ncbi:MAG: prevent-host-death family protein [Desulfobacterium sp.]|nr:prevent-host-death family protein [Desulfobacterium sp.]
MELHPQIIKKNGKNEFVVLPYDEFQKIQEEIASYEDLRCLREAKTEEKDAPTIGMKELKKIITGRTIKSRRPRKFGG